MLAKMTLPLQNLFNKNLAQERSILSLEPTEASKLLFLRIENLINFLSFRGKVGKKYKT